jgi:hypothetical protein
MNKNFGAKGFPHRIHNNNYLYTGGSSGFTGHSLGPAKLPESRMSLIDDLESLITIAENTEEPSALTGVGDYFGDYEDKVVAAIGAKKGGKVHHQTKIKTPMFEEDIAKLCSSDEELNIIAQGGDLISDGCQPEEDNSCLLMLEKEWQEAQKLQEQLPRHNQIFLGSGPNKHLFDQSLISSSNNLQLKNYNMTHNNIVFFFDEDTTIDGGRMA